MQNSLANIISQTYNIKNIISITKINAGYAAENSIVQSENGRFFLKQHRDDAVPHIGYIEAVENYFFRNAIPVVLPLVKQGGGLHFTYKNNTYSLYPFINDLQYKRNELSDIHIESLASMLAQMHLVSKRGIPSDLMKESVEYWDKDKTLKKLSEIESIIINKETQDEFDALALKMFSLKKKFVFSNNAIVADFNLKNDTITHGDYHEQNVFFNALGGISYVFDFEKAKMSPRMLELVRSVLLICFNNDYSERNFKKAARYLKTYHKIYPIDKESFLSSLKVRMIKSFHSTWIEREHYLKGNVKLDDLYFGNFETVKYMSQSFEEFQTRILSFLS